MNKNILLIASLVLICASISGQSQDKQPRIYALEHPELIKLELLPRQLELNEDPKALRAPYAANSKIYFRLQATNTSSQKVTLFIIHTYYQDRLELLRDGQIVPYKTGVDKSLVAKEKDPATHFVQSVTLDPNESREIEYLFLKDWYGRLEPGHYRLSLKHRFEPGQDWIESSPITFEVATDEQNESSPKQRKG